MPVLYEYLCENCGYEFDVTQSIKESDLTVCPFCEQFTLRRVLFPPAFVVRQEATTLGQQAERNEKGMGRYQLEDKRQEHNMDKPKPKPPRPWWRKTDKVNTKLAGLAPKVKIKYGKVIESEPLSKEANKYIMTGKL